MEEDRRNIWMSQLSRVMDRALARERIGIVQNGAQLLISGIEQGVVIFLGIHAVLGGELSLGMLVAFFSYRLMFVDRVKTLTDRIFELKLMGVHISRMMEILNEPREAGVDDPVRENWWEGSAAELSATGLRFRYSDDDPWIIDGLDFRVSPGECVAIIGPSGCGKTTLLKALMGLYETEAGEILVNGCPLSAIGLRTYRSGISGVMQDDHLLAGSIAQNIAGAASTLDMKQIIRAAEAAAIHSEIQRMPMKYDTLVGDRGSNFSAGQMQRIFLARALYKSPNILFLDEASSNLDVITEKAINENIRRLNTTRIIVAHRPETIRFADRIFRMERGVLTALVSAQDRSVETLYNA
jgi:ATP-binding cassette subfamily B protein RaxB